ncbi:MAG: hypothetical protein Q9M94_05225 [Candidatus Gracilibacteria bacterium]|nr:hypothetical protein [Candidatus Gracilibacteria bacterium]MDQ7023122.1 hypothetical protein [Candidatus Gracilibacteria bacterium]
MGRYYGAGKYTTDDYSKTLNIKFLKKYGYLDKGVNEKSGGLYWKRNGEDNGNIGIEINKGKTSGFIRVTFTQTSPDGEKEKLDYKINLVSTSCNYGGIRWWFECPCKGNRCSILYKQNNGIFASRKTLDLCYSEQKESKRSRYISFIMGDAFTKIELIKRTMKYPFRNGEPTKKMRRILELRKKMPTMDDVNNMNKILWGNSRS